MEEDCFRKDVKFVNGDIIWKRKGENHLFIEMRHKRKLMSEEEVKRVLTDAEFGTLACISENGYPYAVPLNFVYENAGIYFHSAHKGHKINNIKQNEKVSFSAVSYVQLLPDKFDTEYDSVIVFGLVKEVTEDFEKKEALKGLIKKYSNEFWEKGIAYIDKSMHTAAVYKIQIEHMTGKRGR